MSAMLLLPGDVLPAKGALTKLGPGTLQTSARSAPAAAAAGSSSSSSSSASPLLVATRAGLVGSDSKGKRMWVEGRGKRYIPAAQESVVGTIVARHGEGYRVDIGGAHMASLDALAFENATKRNRPNLKVGTVVYARVSLANRDMEPELECFAAESHKADGFGELKDGGMLVSCSLHMSRSLLNPDFPLLASIATLFPFETAVGTNGVLWLRAGTVRQTIALGRAVGAVDAGECAPEDVGALVGGWDLGDEDESR